jgi:beta-lactamase class A
VAAYALLALVGNDGVNATLQSLGLLGTEVRWSPARVAPVRAPAGPAAIPVDEPAGQPSPAARPSSEAVPEQQNSRSIRGLQSVPPLGRLDARADAAWHVTTAADMAELLVQLLNGDVVSAAASAQMLELLARQQINNRLPAYLPQGTRVAHKTGNLDGLVHDVGVIWTPAGPYVVAVLTVDNEAIATDLIARIGLLAYQAGS